MSFVEIVPWIQIDMQEAQSYESNMKVKKHHGAYTAFAQIDAIAACRLPIKCIPAISESGSVTNTATVYEDNDDDSNGHPYLAVAVSNLEGNQWGGAILLLDGTTNERICAVQLNTGVSALAWCGIDGDVLACACDNGDIQLFRLTTIMGGHAQSGADVAFVPQESLSLSSSSSLDSPASSFPLEQWGHDDVVTGVSASPFEKTHIATSSWDLTVKLWDIATATKSIATLEGHTDLIWSVAVNQRIAHILGSAAQDCTVRIWDDRQTHSAALTIETKSPVLSIDWHPHHDTIFSVGQEDGLLATYDTRSHRAPLSQLITHHGAVHVLKYSRFHDDLVASGGDDANIFLSNGILSNSTTKKISNQHHDYVRALDWLQLPSKTTCFASGSWDKTVGVWNVDVNQ